MNFFNENDDEKKAGAPVTPSISSPFKKTSAFGKGPMFSRTAGGIMDRLKNLSRKDMAFVGIGLSVLVMVPVAEYMMSQPTKDNLLEGGFGTRDAAGAGAGSGLYEPGINALSQGSPDGSGEVITPLSSRDPASLILGAQPAQPAVALTPPQSAPVENYRDSMKEAARNSFAAAAANTGAPTPIPRMSGALRMAGSFFGDGSTSRTSGQLSGGKIIEDAKSASGKSAKRSMVGPVAVAGYKGVASSTPNSASKGAFEKLRAAADKAAGNFSGDSAIRSLDKAAADSVEIGKGGGGLGAGQDSDKLKNATNSNRDDRHTQSGESLAQMANKTRMQKALEWEMFKKYEIKKQIINAVLSGFTSVITDFIKNIFSGALGMNSSPATVYCWSPASNPASTNIADCAGGVEKVALSKDKDGKYGTLPNRSCICGIGPTCKYDKSGSEEKTEQKPATTSEIVGKDKIEAFDLALADAGKQAAQCVNATGDKEMASKTYALASRLQVCSDRGQEIFGQLSEKADSVNGGAVAYANNVLTAETANNSLNSSLQKHIDFIDKMIGQCNSAEGCAKQTTAVEGYTVSGNRSKEEMLAGLNNARKILAGAQTTIIGKQKGVIAFHNKAATFYTGNLSAVSKVAAEARNAMPTLITKDTVDAMKAINDKAQSGKLSAEEQNKLRTTYMALSGMDTAYKGEGAQTAPAANRSGSAVALESMISYRGAKKEDIVGGKFAVDDADARKTEGEDWTKTKPSSKVNQDPNLGLQYTQPVANIAANSLRVATEIPPDVLTMAETLKASSDLTEVSVSSEVVKAFKVLSAIGIDPTKPVTGAGTVNTSGTGVSGTATPAESKTTLSSPVAIERNRQALDADTAISKGGNADRLISSMPSAEEGSDYAEEKAKVDAAAAKLATKKAELVAANDKLKSATSDAEATSQISAVDAKRREYNAALNEFRGAYSTAMKTPDGMAPNTSSELGRVKGQAGADYAVLTACVRGVTGLKPNPGGRCNWEKATALRTSKTAFESDWNVVSGAGELSGRVTRAANGLSSNRKFACEVAAGCNIDVEGCN